MKGYRTFLVLLVSLCLFCGIITIYITNNSVSGTMMSWESFIEWVHQALIILGVAVAWVILTLAVIHRHEH